MVGTSLFFCDLHCESGASSGISSLIVNNSSAKFIKQSVKKEVKWSPAGFDSAFCLVPLEWASDKVGYQTNSELDIGNLW